MKPTNLTSALLHNARLEQLKSVRLIASDMDGTLTQIGKFTPQLLQTLLDLATAGIEVLVVTGRSAGWVNGIVSYLPIAGAIAENGGVFYATADQAAIPLIPLPTSVQHRQHLAAIFAQLQARFPRLQPSIDNSFRLTDWTFDVAGFSQTELTEMAEHCQQQGWSFTYSTVQCHIKPKGQDKAPGLLTVLSDRFPHYQAHQILTVGDSPNDESLFNPAYFPLSVGVANVRHYSDRLQHQPTYITQAEEAEGFCELAQRVLHSQSG